MLSQKKKTKKGKCTNCGETKEIKTLIYSCNFSYMGIKRRKRKFQLCASCSAALRTALIFMKEQYS